MTQRNRPEAEVYREAQAVADGILAKLNPPPAPGQFSFDRYIDDAVAGVTDRPGIVRAATDPAEAERLNKAEWEAMHDASRHMLQVSRTCSRMAETAALCGQPGEQATWIQTAQDSNRYPAALHYVLSEVLRRTSDAYAVVEEVGRDRVYEAMDFAGVARGMALMASARSGGPSVACEKLLHHAGLAHRTLASLVERHAANLRHRAAIGKLPAVK